jgi:hypothetical protein
MILVFPAYRSTRKSTNTRRVDDIHGWHAPRPRQALAAYPGRDLAALYAERKQAMSCSISTFKMIAGLKGPTLLAIGIAMLVNARHFPEMAKQIGNDPGSKKFRPNNERNEDRRGNKQWGMEQSIRNLRGLITQIEKGDE